MSYRLSILNALLFFLLAPPAQAELTIIEDAEGQEGLTVFRMTVTPAAEPVPALKHRFRVPMHLRKPGNAATHYLRSLGENNLRGLWRRVHEKFSDEVDRWYTTDISIDDLPMEQVSEVAGAFEGYIRDYIDPASRCRQCEWGLEEMDFRGVETMAYLLPDVQESRSMSRALSICTRFAIAEHRYVDAMDLMRMNYQLGQDFGKQRFLVCALVGLAEVRMANSTVLDLIGAPNAPNLYWALSELPVPLIDMRETVNLEMSMGLRIFPFLLDAETADHTPQEWARLIGQIPFDQPTLWAMGDGDFREDSMRLLGSKLINTGMAAIAYPEAKRRLVDSGMDEKKVNQMAPGQLLAIDAAREYQRIADEHEKWWHTPYQVAVKKMRAAHYSGRGGQGLQKMQGGYGALLADLLLPAIQAARTAQIRLQWQMNAIRAIEALRMHAAETGVFPTSLNDVEVVPVPKNPITEQPFMYHLDGKTAVLVLPFSDGMPGVAWRFEIRLK